MSPSGHDGHMGVAVALSAGAQPSQQVQKELRRQRGLVWPLGVRRVLPGEGRTAGVPGSTAWSLQDPAGCSQGRSSELSVHLSREAEGQKWGES